MKNYTLLLLFIFSGFFTFGQKATTLLSENFSSGFPPAGWTIDDVASQWSQSSTTNAGGTAPEAKLSWVSGTHTTHLISPEINLTGFSAVMLSFKQFLSDYSSSGYTIGVVTRSGGGSWNTVWSLTPPGDIGPETKEILISNSDVGASDFQFALFLDGNFYNFNYWYIDDVLLTVPDNNDDLLYSVNTNPYLAQGSVDISCTLKNLGLTNLTSADINYQIDNGSIITENITGLNIATTETFDHTFSTPWNAVPGDYNLKVWISDINGNGSDDNSDNDTLKLTVHVATQNVARTPLYEEFTSSTCSPCATFNSTYFNTDFLNSNSGNFSLIKYQMNWPSPGDPYYTEEGGVRRAYYGVSGVPTLFIDSNVDTEFDQSQLQSDLNNELAKPAFFDINATHQISGNSISLQADILSYLNADNFTVQIAVVEKTTTENVASNGETEFHNVMMKMLPDAYGTSKNFKTNEHSYLSYTYDMSSTNVEEMSDLEVILFIQNNETKEVFQSAVSSEDALPTPSVSITPGNGDLNINVNTSIDISFNQYMRFTDDSEINSSNISNFITLTNPSKASIPYTAEINDSKSVITLTPDNYLPEMTDITVTIDDAAIEGINDAALNGTSATFTTGAYPDANVNSNPVNGSSDVNILSNIILTFDDPMRKINDSEITDGDISSFVTLTDPTKANIPFTGTINAEKTIITINPNAFLTELTNFTITIVGNTIENKYNKSLSESSVTFTTGTYPAANVIFNPADGATDVNLNSDITLTFDDPMRKIDDSEITDGDIGSFVTLTDPSKGNITFTGTINAEKTVITVIPDNDLPEQTDITVTVSGDVIENGYDKSLSESSAVFTTKSNVGISKVNGNFKISPNPAYDFIKISGLNNAEIIISDISGKQLITQNITSENEPINIQGLDSGIYFIKIISNGNIFTEKFIKK